MAHQAKARYHQTLRKAINSLRKHVSGEELRKFVIVEMPNGVGFDISHVRFLDNSAKVVKRGSDLIKV